MKKAVTQATIFEAPASEKVAQFVCTTEEESDAKLVEIMRSTTDETFEVIRDYLIGNYITDDNKTQYILLFFWLTWKKPAICLSEEGVLKNLFEKIKQAQELLDLSPEMLFKRLWLLEKERSKSMTARAKDAAESAEKAATAFIANSKTLLSIAYKAEPESPVHESKMPPSVFSAQEVDPEFDSRLMFKDMMITHISSDANLLELPLAEIMSDALIKNDTSVFSAIGDAWQALEKKAVTEAQTKGKANDKTETEFQTEVNKYISLPACKLGLFLMLYGLPGLKKLSENSETEIQSTLDFAFFIIEVMISKGWLDTLSLDEKLKIKRDPQSVDLLKSVCEGKFKDIIEKIERAVADAPDLSADEIVPQLAASGQHSEDRIHSNVRAVADSHPSITSSSFPDYTYKLPESLPDGSNEYTIPGDNWKTVSEFCTDWKNKILTQDFAIPLTEQERSSVQKFSDGSLPPAGTQIFPDPENSEKSVICILHNSRIYSYTIDLAVPRPFFVAPISKSQSECILYALKPQRDPQKYLYDQIKIEDTKYRTTIQYAFPQPQQGLFIPKIYKEEPPIQLKIDSKDANITIFESRAENQNRITLMPYYGMDLVKYFASEKQKDTLTKDTVIQIAKNCCDSFRIMHLQNLYVNDIKPTNICIQTDEKNSSSINIKIIDEESMTYINPQLNSETETDSSSQTPAPLSITSQYGAPELFVSPSPSLQSEAYGLGQTFDWMARQMEEKDTDTAICLHYLASKMNEKDPKKRLTIENILKYFEFLKQDKIFELEAIYCICQERPELTEKELDNIFKNFNNPEIGAPLACAILGVNEYLAANKAAGFFNWKHGKEGEMAARTAMTDLSNLAKDNDEVTKDEIQKIITAATSTTTSPHSRKSTFQKYTEIGEKIKTQTDTDSGSAPQKSTPLELKQQIILIKLNKHFPKHTHNWQKIINAHTTTNDSTVDTNSLLLNVILKSIDYLEKSKTAGWHGKRSVHALVDQLLKKNTARLSAKIIQSEVTSCYQETTAKYKLFGVFGKKSCVDNVGSRAYYFQSIMPFKI